MNGARRHRFFLRPHTRWLPGLIVGTMLGVADIASAGHEFPFYPSFYPQEIAVEALDAQAAAQRLAQGTLHAYAGTGIAGLSDSAKVGSVRSLGGYVVATFDRRVPALAGGAARCAKVAGLKAALGEGYTWHPYPVTPFHADYLEHADRAEAARASGAARSDVRLRASDAAAARLLRPVSGATGETEGTLEIVDPAALADQTRTRYNGWSGPPWIRRGWYDAYLLLAPAVSDGTRRARIEEMMRRLTHGDYRSLEERVNLERVLVASLQSGCERAVLGYTVRRERYGADYSQGVENVGYDALEGLGSAIFPRTVKLRDFPWNGWLDVAAPAAPSAAWNPVVGGFDDAFGRLVWDALADPAYLPSPHAGGWIENRVNASVEKATGEWPVPEDALLPEPGTGRLLRVGRGHTAKLRIVYRVRNSSFHDGTPMSVDDLLYAYAFAAAWGDGGAADPGIAQATALARERLRGIRVLRVETQTLAFGEDKLTYQVPVVEVYLDGTGNVDAATVAPPWTTLPWHLLALLEEGARRGLFALSAQAAARSGLRELDPVRDAAQVRSLFGLERELEERAYVPPSLAPHVSAQEARDRYRRLREFFVAHGHWLVTNGPYLLTRWDGAKAVLGVFRDPSYPKGIGSFNAYAVPLKAYVTRIEKNGSGADVQTETEWLERLGRDVRVVRGSFASRLAEQLTASPPPAPVCRYLLVRPDGAVGAAGAVRSSAAGTCRLEFRNSETPAGPGSYQLVVAAVQEGSTAGAPIKVIRWER